MGQCEEQVSWAESKIFSVWLSKISTVINIMGSFAKTKHPWKTTELSIQNIITLWKVLCHRNFSCKCIASTSKGERSHDFIFIWSLYIYKWQCNISENLLFASILCMLKCSQGHRRKENVGLFCCSCDHGRNRRIWRISCFDFVIPMAFVLCTIHQFWYKFLNDLIVARAGSTYC